MFDKNDEGAGVGLWVVIGIITLLLFGLIGGLAIKSLHAKAAKAKPAAVAVAAASGASAAAAADTLLEGPNTGDLAGVLFFGTGESRLPENAAAELAKVQAALGAAPARKLVLSGFHDASGDAAKNAELAKERAKAVRDALKAAGVDAARIALRKPEVTTGAGNAQEARRVELRLVD